MSEEKAPTTTDQLPIENIRSVDSFPELGLKALHEESRRQAETKPAEVPNPTQPSETAQETGDTKPHELRTTPISGDVKVINRADLEKAWSELPPDQKQSDQS